MRWFLIAVFSALITWYFADQSLTDLILAQEVGEGWQKIAVGWHIIPKIWLTLLIIAVGAGVAAALVISSFSFREQKLQNEFEQKIKELNEKNSESNSDILQDAKQSANCVAQLEIREFRLKEQFAKREEELISKINHQHSTIQRLHKKNQRLS